MPSGSESRPSAISLPRESSLMLHWLRRLARAWSVEFSSRRRKPGKKGTTYGFVEQLEDRVLLSASLWTDQPDYSPGSTATINGSGFLPGEVVNLRVIRTDGIPDGPPGNVPWNVTDGDNSFTTPYQDSSSQW